MNGSEAMVKTLLAGAVDICFANALRLGSGSRPRHALCSRFI